jgi:tetratricopeptide (TPR) repeat protein
MTESLITSLSQLPNLSVKGRSSVFRYKNKDTLPQQVGKELNVKAIVSGRVVLRGNDLTLHIELVDASTETALWSADYNRPMSNLVSLQSEIAREVATKVQSRLSDTDRQTVTRTYTANADAYQCYLRGRYFWNKRTADGLNKAIQEFQKAIERDPNYALGYVGLADSYSILEQVAGFPATDTLPKARAAADRALQIDDSLSEAHTASANIYYLLWRWPEAEEEFKRAIALNPKYATAHHLFSRYLRTRRRFDEAMSEIKLAQELDPLSPIISSNGAFLYFLKNDLDTAIEQDKKIIEFDPSYWVAHSDIAWAYLKQRRYEEATLEFQKGVEASGRSSLSLGNLGNCYGVTGKRAEAMALLKELEERYTKREAIGFNIASVYAGLGGKDQAFAWLEKDFQQRSGQLQEIVWWPNFESLRTDPRYLDLVGRMGLQP